MFYFLHSTSVLSFSIDVVLTLSIEKLLEALEILLFNTYIQFDGSIFKQILGIPMGGDASLLLPFMLIMV